MNTTSNNTTTDTTLSEITPLMMKAMSKSSEQNNNSNTNTNATNTGTNVTGQASIVQTIINLMKTCMGTGTLALAYACQQSGIIVYIIGLIFIAIWNIYSVYLLIDCLNYIPKKHHRYSHVHTNRGREHATTQLYLSDDEEDEQSESEDEVIITSTFDNATNIHEHHQHPPIGTSTLGRVAWYALYGDVGLQILDVMLILLLHGIIIAYISANVAFIADTPFSINTYIDAIITGLIMTIVALVPDMGYLSNASAIGLVILCIAFIIIAGYGILSYGEDSYDNNNIIFMTTTQQQQSSSSTTTSLTSLQILPLSINGISHFFGITVFGYGVVPLTYNLQESMKEPKHIVKATIYALGGVAITYIILGVGLYALFPKISADVLHELPSYGILPNLIRLAMVWTVLVTAPLLIVPCAELLEGKYCTSEHNHNQHHHHHHISNEKRILVRLGVVSICVIIAVLLPGFVQVLSFVGCFCVATVSFCIPPLLHLQLLTKKIYYKNNVATYNTNKNSTNLSKSTIIGDVILLIWGVIATIVSTYCTLRS